jgi:adenosylmethionine-8-amino-7-oxononanoate aminotransferase
MAIDIINDSQSGYLDLVGIEIRHHAIECGVLLSPLGNVLYLMPPTASPQLNSLGWITNSILRSCSVPQERRGYANEFWRKFLSSG